MAVQASIGTAAMPSMWSIRAAVESFYAREGCVCIAWTWSHNGCEEGALAWSDLHCNTLRDHPWAGTASVHGAPEYAAVRDISSGQD